MVIQAVPGQLSSGIVLDYVATATLDDDPPLLEIIGTGWTSHVVFARSQWFW